MIPFIQNAKQPCRIPLAFDLAVSKGITGLRWAVAYITAAGCHDLVDRLRQQLGRGWDQARKVIVTSCDYGITEPAAVDFMAGLPNCCVMLSSPEVLGRPDFLPEAAFHPKLYLFDRPRGLAAIVGSANLTVRAFTSNREAVCLYRSTGPQPAWEEAWTGLISDAVEFSPALRTQYRAARAHHKPPIESDPPPRDPPDAGGLPVFLEEIRAGHLVPVSFEHLWVEAGAMSSSGSRNQLELPRGGNRFFGFTFDDYDNRQTDIGIPVLSVRGRSFRDRKIVWHGGTGMERHYLPTGHQSGLNYQSQLILFRRAGRSFELVVFPWDSAAALAIRAASRQIGRVYQLGIGSPRICGVY